MLETQIKRLRKYMDCAVTPGNSQHVEQVEGELWRKRLQLSSKDTGSTPRHRRHCQ